MNQALSIRFFAHSWISDWNHGNAHFLRGLVRELVIAGHQVRCYEEIGAWSLSNLMEEGEAGSCAIDDFHRIYPELDVLFYRRDETLPAFLNRELAGADLVIIHEWNEPDVVHEILSRKRRLGFRALFHDTHHRAYSNASQILRFQLHLFDGVLAFGESIRRIYLDGFGVERAWTFHEAADISVFHPIERGKENDLVWIGNWGDEERTQELMEFLVEPAMHLTAARRRVLVHGVRYPEQATDTLRRSGIDYAGYLANLGVPEVYARSRLALHVPRRQYANGLSGVPTIRVFEALACGIPLVCAPWADTEELFRPGQDYVLARDPAEMRVLLGELLESQSMRLQIAASGLETIRQHHTCRHRAGQLMEIFGEITR
ncbi:MAG: glycosyltransferase [Candidatus Korobacteraceae bacterium]